MSKERSQAHLDHLKSVEISEMVMDQVKFDIIVAKIMHQRATSAPHGLMKVDIEEIKKARKFWKEMRIQAEKFIQDGE